MNEFLLFDPLFRVPFFTGLCLAVALSLIGAFLRMRNEWLAALGLSQIAAAGGMASVPLGIPVLAGAFGAACLATLIRSALPRVGNSHHALLILIGWSGTLVIGSYADHGHVIGETLLRGQLYFTHIWHLAGSAVLLFLVLGLYKWLSPRLLKDRFFPDYHMANRIPSWPHSVLYALIVMAAAVLGTISMGAFPAFALLFVPSWIGFVMVDGWFRSVVASVFIGCAVYVAAFILAMLADLPFGPALTGLLAFAASLRLLTALRRRNIEVSGDESRFHYLSPPARNAKK